MSKDILTFQVQLSGIMETVLKAAMHEITCLVEGSFQGEVVRSRKEVETLKQRLQWSERRWRERERRIGVKCVECGRTGVATEEAEHCSSDTQDENDKGEKNNQQGDWSTVSWDAEGSLDATPMCGEEATEGEINPSDILYKDHNLKETQTTLEIDEEANAHTTSVNGKDWDSTGREREGLLGKALKTEPRDVHISPHTEPNRFGFEHSPARAGHPQNKKQPCHVKTELVSFNADVLGSDHFLNIIHMDDKIAVPDQFGSCSGSSQSTMLCDIIKDVSQQRTAEDYLSGCVTGSQHICPYCGHSSTSLVNFNIHLQSHGADSLQRCPQFQISSPYSSNRMKQQQDHRQDSSSSFFHGKRFHAAGNLEKHQSVDRGGPLHRCLQCGKTFNRAYNLKIHQRSHTGERPYLCSQCKKGFISPTDLRRHKRIHTGEKPYACTLCGSKFNQSWTLKVHQRIHTQEKPHCCMQCGKCFRCSGDLRKHRRVHTGEKPYVCELCGKRYSQSQNLKSHRCFIKRQVEDLG